MWRVKVKFTIEHTNKAQKGYSSILSLTSAVDRGGWSTPIPGPFTPGKDPVPIVQELGEPQGRSGLARTGIRSADRTALSALLYRLSYVTSSSSVTYDKPDSGLTCSIFRWVPGTLPHRVKWPGLKVATYCHLAARKRMCAAIAPAYQYTLMYQSNTTKFIMFIIVKNITRMYLRCVVTEIESVSWLYNNNITIHAFYT